MRNICMCGLMTGARLLYKDEDGDKITIEKEHELKVSSLSLAVSLSRLLARSLALSLPPCLPACLSLHPSISLSLSLSLLTRVLAHVRALAVKPARIHTHCAGGTRVFVECAAAGKAFC